MHVNEVDGGTSAVYTTDETYTQKEADLKYATKMELTAKGEAIATNTANIATNQGNIKKLEDDKLSKDVASATYATNKALNDLENAVTNKVDESVVEEALDGKANTDLSNLTEAGKSAIKNTMSADMDSKANKADVNNALNAKANKTDLDTANGKITDLQKKTAKLSDDGMKLTGMTAVGGATVSGTNVNARALKVTGNISDGTVNTTLAKIDASMKQTETNKGDIADLKKKTNTQQTWIGRLNDRTTQISYNAAKGTTVNGVDFTDAEVNANGKGLTGVTTLNTTGDATVGGALNAGSLIVENASNLKGDVTMDKTLSVTGDTTLKGTKVDGKLTVTDEADLKNTTVGGTLGVTGEATFKDKVTMEKDLEVKGELKTDKIAMENKKTDADGTRYNSSTTITADGITHIGEVEKNGVITKSQFTHTEEGSETYATKGDKTDWTETRSDVKADGVKTEVKDSKGNRTNTSQTTEVINGFAIDEDGNSSTTSQTAKDINGNVTDKDGNKTDMKVTATENSIQIQDKDGKNTNLQVNTMGSSKTEITNGDGKTTKTEQTATDITNTAQNGTIKNEAKDIVNNATGDMTNTIGGKLTTTVTGQATENFNGGLNTTVTGAENHTVTGKQTNTVEGGQENIISGGQTNTITGGQINNITGDQTTTITGNKTETVTENVTEDYKKNLTTTVGGNEIHEVKGTKTETVEGKLTENFKGGQETNVTGDQTTNVSGTQTTTATDIKRNASSGMIDTIDNDYGTNTETKVAGKTTTDVSIKGTGEKGQYIRGATESRDYLIKDTSTNTETKTAEATSTEITDGTNKASTIQDAKNLAGSVTNGTETGVSGIHANDDGSVSIDSAVAGGGMSSVINQKKDSIQSAVGDGTNSTVIHQDKDNVTIASSNGMVGLVGKDIVNNAQDTITNTAGTSITNQVNDSKVTTDANGTTFENNTPAVSDGGATTTKINGNQITTGRVDANELGVSDKDGTNTADLSVKAGEGVKASASDGTTTGSLDVTADEVGSTVKDASGKGSTFKQRIDAIMMESKDVSITAEETLTNEAKVITNKASEVINNEAININNTATGIITSKASEIKNQADKLISNKVGENTWENMEDGKITTSIKDGTKQNLTQSDAAGTTQSTVDGAKSTVTIQNADGLAGAVTDGTNTSVQNQTASAIATDVKDGAGNENASVANATTSANTIKNGTKANTVISTADGTSFINSEAAAPVTGASGAGTHLNTTIKGNTIKTSKVTMDYADVMKDLGVHGSAKVDNNLEVGGTTTTKTLKVTENAEIGGNATITGDVTARSYKVGDKTYIDANGIHANGQKITDVADGSISEGSKDAVNGGQLYNVKNDLEGKVNKVGANAAAMANLHPMEFDPDSKWNIAAAIGNYGSETAAALGAFYRPNDDVMVNLSTAFGTGENMVGGGVSVRLGKGGNKLSREESNALKDQVNDLTARMEALLSVLNPNMSKDFPDVPENHWAYEAVSRLAGNDIVQGYPDGEFHGERTMTRYEMAEIIYNALSRGAEAEKELVEEFKPELQAMAASEKATAERAEG